MSNFNEIIKHLKQIKYNELWLFFKECKTDGKNIWYFENWTYEDNKFICICDSDIMFKYETFEMKKVLDIDSADKVDLYLQNCGVWTISKDYRFYMPVNPNINNLDNGIYI